MRNRTSGLITASRAELGLQAEKLSQQLQEAPGELEELTVAERAARRLAEQLHAETRTTPGVPARSRAARCCWCRSASATTTPPARPSRHHAPACPSSYCLANPPKLSTVFVTVPSPPADQEQQLNSMLRRRSQSAGATRTVPP